MARSNRTHSRTRRIRQHKRQMFDRRRRSDRERKHKCTVINSAIRIFPSRSPVVT